MQQGWRRLAAASHAPSPPPTPKLHLPAPQEVVPAAAAACEEGPDLSCLDHSYFLGEVSRLVQRAEALRGRLYRDTMNCGRRGDAQSERALAGLAEVLARLESYRDGLGGDHPAPFEAEPLLHGARARGGGGRREHGLLA
jgi:hypothetical protein